MNLEEYRKAIGAFLVTSIGLYLTSVGGILLTPDSLMTFATFATPLKAALGAGILAGVSAWGFENRVNGENVITVAKQNIVRKN